VLVNKDRQRPQLQVAGRVFDFTAAGFVIDDKRLRPVEGNKIRLAGPSALKVVVVNPEPALNRVFAAVGRKDF